MTEQEWYHNYLKSPEWAKKREYVNRKYNGKCAVCGEPGTQVHHLRYRRNFETFVLDENLDDDLVLLCKRCHRAYHEIEKLGKLSDPNIKREVLKTEPQEIFVDRFIEFITPKDVAYNRNGLNFADYKIINEHTDKFLESCSYLRPVYETLEDKLSWKMDVSNYFASLHKAAVMNGKAAGASRKALEKRYGKSCVKKALEEDE